MTELQDKKNQTTTAFANLTMELYRQILDALPVAVYTCDADGFVTHYNKVAADLWGTKPKIGIQMWCGSWRLYKGNGMPLELHECPMAIALKEKQPVTNQEIIVERTDGSKRQVHPHAIPLFDQTQQLIGAVNMLLDVTERRLMEEKSALLASIVQSSDDAIVSKTLGGIITSWNQAAERIFGYSAAEMIGESIMKIIPEDRWHEEDLILSRIRSGERVDHFISKRRTKDGRLLDFSLTISPVRNKYGNVIGASKIARVLP